MTNIMDYIRWRGDLSFLQDPPNAVDSLVFSALAYIRFSGRPTQKPDRPITLSEAAEELFLQEDWEELGRPNHLALLREAAQTRRFGTQELMQFCEEFVPGEDTQFAAMTFLLEDFSIFIAFRGTDNTLVGWKEDFNMCFQESVPAQRLAVEYLERMYGRCRVPVRLCGHSKGGNLAMYAASRCSPEVHHAVRDVYNNDGPGFSEYMLGDPGYLEMVPRIHTFVPQSSIIGLLMEHAEPYTIIRSAQVGILQHDIFSWEIVGRELIPVQELTPDARFVSATLKDWLMSMDMESRNQMVDALFRLLSCGNVERAVDIFHPKNLPRYMFLLGTDENVRRVLSGDLSNLLDSARRILAAEGENRQDAPMAVLSDGEAECLGGNEKENLSDLTKS